MNKSRFAIAAAGAVAALPLMGALPAPPVQQVQQVQLFSYGYSPGPIVLSAGQPVTLQFVNRAGKGHDFSAPEFFATARILAGSIKDGEVDLRGGESATVTLVPARGTYKVHCGHPFHAMLGMHTHIVVR